jgi:hypothetical protein
MASDGFLTGIDDLIVAVDAPPVVNPGPNQTNNFPASITLNGTVTDDSIPTNEVLTIAWSKVSGPGTVVFDDPQSASTLATHKYRIG